MLDKLLEIGRSFDWITPVFAELQNIANGPHCTFLIPEACGWSGHEIGRMLREHGVRYWGMMIVRHHLMLTVRQQQAGWTQYLLQRSSIPILNPMPSSQAAVGASSYAARRGPKAKSAHRHGALENLNRLVDSLAERLRL